MLGRVEQVMLAKAVASFGLPLASPPLRRNSNNDKLMNKCVLPLLNPNPVGRPGARVVLVRGGGGGDGGGGGYSRTPLETAGAYELIDKDTGEKVIVWGGTDDDHDPPIPPKHLLLSSNWNKDPSQPTTSAPGPLSLSQSWFL